MNSKEKSAFDITNVLSRDFCSLPCYLPTYLPTYLELFGPTHPWSCQQQVWSPQVSDADDVWVLFVGFFMLHLMVCLNFAAGQCPPPVMGCTVLLLCQNLA